MYIFVWIFLLYFIQKKLNIFLGLWFDPKFYCDLGSAWNFLSRGILHHVCENLFFSIILWKFREKGGQILYFPKFLEKMISNLIIWSKTMKKLVTGMIWQLWWNRLHPTLIQLNFFQFFFNFFTSYNVLHIPLRWKTYFLLLMNSIILS